MAWVPPQVGQRASWTRTIGPEDVEAFARISGDRNPLHFDPDFAARTRAGRLIVQGGLTTALFNALVAMELPGPGSRLPAPGVGLPGPGLHRRHGNRRGRGDRSPRRQADHPPALRRPALRTASRSCAASASSTRCCRTARLQPEAEASRTLADPRGRRRGRAAGDGAVVQRLGGRLAARRRVGARRLGLPMLTIAVQLGFALGALVIAATAAADVDVPASACSRPGRRSPRSPTSGSPSWHRTSRRPCRSASSPGLRWPASTRSG